MASIWQKITAAFESEEIIQEDVLHQLHLAAAALLFEMCRADFEIMDVERLSVRDAIRDTFKLTPQETRELLVDAEMHAEHAVSIQQFTCLINEHFQKTERIGVINCLWRVAYSDGVLNKHEEHLVRKVADLLHISHTDFIKAKHRVLAEIEGPSDVGDVMEAVKI